jgi:hypothetical protein
VEKTFVGERAGLTMSHLNAALRITLARISNPNASVKTYGS